MGLKRDKWKEEFRAEDLLRWQCPACHVSPLRVVADSLKIGETSASESFRAELAFEPDLHVDGRFSCMMDCAHCHNEVGVAGTYRLFDERSEDIEHGETGGYVELYRPKYFTESPYLVEIPESTPEAITNELIASFQLFWSDPLACTNRIRSSVEKLLTAERIPKTTGRTAGKRRRQFHKLHNRIELYRKKRPDVAEKLMAVKWIGNAGSHAGGATVEDALDGYELMDWVLDTLYARRHRRASELTRTINRRRAPRSPRRRSREP
jgi:hypothetical protein